jgi:hypothetical protein
MEFYDAASPGSIPAGSYACLYADGLYKASAQQAARMKAVRWITVLGGADAAAYAGCADFEAGNPVYEGSALREWVQGRQAKGMRARVYTDLANLPLVRMRCAELKYEVWLATLDGRKLSANYTSGLWAVQFAGGVTAPYDVSCLYGEW